MSIFFEESFQSSGLNMQQSFSAGLTDRENGGLQTHLRTNIMQSYILLAVSAQIKHQLYIKHHIVASAG